MDEAEKKDLGEARELGGLIDVSSEDDCLIDSSAHPKDQSSENQEEQKSLMSLEAVVVDRTKEAENSSEQRERPPHLSESMEPERAKRIGKCNLRKSLAWDSAFFTNAGVLDAEELSSIIGGIKSSDKHSLPDIQEDLRQSTDSISTLDSDTLTLESIEADLFVDIRASIQKSRIANNSAILSGKSRSGETGAELISSKKVDADSRNKTKAKPLLKKSSCGIQGPGKTIKQSSVFPQATEPTARIRVSTSSIPKPPKVVGRVNPVSTAQAKRESVGDNRAKVDNDNAKGRIAPLLKIPRMSDSHSKGVSAAGKGAQSSKMRNLSNSSSIVPQRRLSSVSSSAGSLTKTGSSSSRSSIDSSSSASSDSVGKSSLITQKRKIDPKTLNLPASGSMPRTTIRTAVRHKSQPGNSNLSAYMKSIPKPSSSISPASSISEWSCESSSSTSTINQHSSNIKASLNCISPSRGNLVNNDSSQASNLLGASKDQPSDGCQNQGMVVSSQTVKRASAGRGMVACPGLAKPSGLRMPSPKIGFFDGVKPAAHTPKRDAQSHSGLQIGLPKITARVSSPSGGSSRGKSGKLQTTRTATAIRNVKTDTRESPLNMKTGSPTTVQNAPTSSKEFSRPLRNTESCGISSEVKNELTLEIGKDCHLKAESSTGGPDAVIHVLVSDSSAESRTPMASQNTCQETAFDMQPAPLKTVHDSQTALTKSSSAVRNVKSCYISSEVQNDLSLEIEKECHLKAESNSTEGSGTAKYIKYFDLDVEGMGCEDGLEIDAQETSLNIQPTLLTPVRDAPTASIKLSGALGDAESFDLSSKFQNVLSLKIGEESHPKAESSDTGGPNSAKYGLDSHFNAEGKRCEVGLKNSRTPMAIQNTTEEITLNKQPIAHMPVQDAPNSSVKLYGESSGISSEVQDDLLLKVGGESHVKAESSSLEGPYAVEYVSGSDLNVEEGCECGLKSKTDVKDGGCAHLENTKIPRIKEGGLNWKSCYGYDIEIAKASQIVDEGASCGEHSLYNCVHLPSKANEKEEADIGDQIEDLSRLLGVMNLNTEQKREISDDPLSESDVNHPEEIGALKSSSRDLPVCGQKDGSLNTSAKFTSLISPLATLEFTAATRIPLAAKNSFGNSNDVLHLPKGSAIEEVETLAVLPAIEVAEKENI